MNVRLGIFFFAATLLSACGEPVTTTPAAPLQADVSGLPLQVVESREVLREVLFDGVVEALNRSTVAAQTSGRVMALPFDVGDVVPPGAVILQLTSKEQGAQVDAAESALAEVRARLREAAANLARAEDIYAKQLISRAEFDRVQANHKAARARAESAQANLRRAREALDYTVVRAPYGGMVLQRHVQVGEFVAPGAPLLTGLSLDALRIVVDVPQQQAAALRRHRQARVLLEDGRELPVAALRIPPAADPATHSFRIRAELAEGEHGIYPGTLVKLAFVSGKDEQLLLPAGALVQRGELTAAYVLSAAGRLDLRLLRIGTPLASGEVPVMAGLVAGERVVTDPIVAAVAYKQQFAGATDE